MTMADNSLRKIVFVYLGPELPEYAEASLNFASVNSKLDVVLVVDHHHDIRIDGSFETYMYDSEEITFADESLNNFRNGFWLKTTQRFYALQAYVRDKNIQSCFHAELDNLVFDLSDLGSVLDNIGSGLFVPRDHKERAISSLIYINSSSTFDDFCEFSRNFSFASNDMEITAKFLDSGRNDVFGLPTSFDDKPIFSESDLGTFSVIPSASVGIFDAAAIGQWYFGIDPRNSYKTISNRFRNEKYSGPLEEYQLNWNSLESSMEIGLKRGELKPMKLHNLHIHSKIITWLVKDCNLERVIELTNNGSAVIINRNFSGRFRSVGVKFKLLRAYPRLRIADYLRGADFKFIGGVAVNIALLYLKLRKSGSFSPSVRSFLSLVQPADPLAKDSLPVIDVVIPVTDKDFENLDLVVEGIRKTVTNPIGEIKIITPKQFVAVLNSKFQEIRILCDDEVLPSEIISYIDSFVPKGRSGWVKQQLIKFIVSLESAQIGTLVVDADTILTAKRAWLNESGVQVICIADEYHQPYIAHQRKVFGESVFRWSFVTHHQLMQTTILKEIFGERGERLLDWLHAADFSEDSAISEYHTYGEWISVHKPDLVAYAKWNNKSLAFGDYRPSYEELVAGYNKYFSISSHSYLK